MTRAKPRKKAHVDMRATLILFMVLLHCSTAARADSPIWTVREGASAYDYSLIGVEAPRCVLNAEFIEFFWTGQFSGWLLIVDVGEHPFDYTGAEAFFDGDSSQDSIFDFESIDVVTDDKRRIIMSAFRATDDGRSSSFVETMANSRTLDVWAAGDGFSVSIDRRSALRFLECVERSEPTTNARSEQSIASNAVGAWCQYTGGSGDVIFDQWCEVSTGDWLSDCEYRSDLKSRYDISFTTRSSVTLELTCSPWDQDRLNGVEVYSDASIINGRRYYSYRLESGEMFQFELNPNPVGSDVSPWSSDWRQQGQSGLCTEKSHDGVFQQKCTKIEQSFVPGASGGEVSGSVEYSLADGRRFEESTVEEMVSILYELPDGSSITGDNFGELRLQVQESGGRDDPVICYLLTGENREFCFARGVEETLGASRPVEREGSQPMGAASPDFAWPMFVGDAVYGADNSQFADFLKNHVGDVIFADLVTGYSLGYSASIELAERCDEAYRFQGTPTSTSYNRDQAAIFAGLSKEIDGELVCGDFLRIDLRHAVTSEAGTGAGVYQFKLTGFFVVSRLGRWNDAIATYELKGVEAGADTWMAARRAAASRRGAASSPTATR